MGDTGNAYIGRRDERGEVFSVTANGQRLPYRLDIYNHSPDGFEWGYTGSGPAQLALAILAHEWKNDDEAFRWHQIFKFQVIAALDQESGFRIDSAAIAAWVANVENKVG